MDRLQQVADGQGETLASYSYNRAGGLRKLRYGNGIQTEYEYGDDGNLSSLVTVTGQGRVILNLGYAYDGNVTRLDRFPSSPYSYSIPVWRFAAS